MERATSRRASSSAGERVEVGGSGSEEEAGVEAIDGDDDDDDDDDGDDDDGDGDDGDDDGGFFSARRVAVPPLARLVLFTERTPDRKLASHGTD